MMISWVGLVLPVVLAYALTAVWVWDNWMLPDSYYSHGPLIPLVAAFFVWRRLGDWRRLPASFDPRGWWLLGPGLALHLCGAALMVDSLSAASLCLTVPGLVLLTQGVPRWRATLPVVGLLPFAIPMPMFVTGKVVFLLKEIAVNLGLGLANVLGAGATRIGANIRVPDDSRLLVVADACGGLRSLVSLMTVAYVIAFLMSSARRRMRVLLLVLAVPIAIASNVLRIAAMCWMSSKYGVEFGSGVGHDVANAVAWILALGAMLWLDGRMSRPGSVAPAAEEAA